MSDPLRKPTSGEEFVPSARQFGMFIDAAVAARDRSRGANGGNALGPAYVLVRNDTGADLTVDHPILGLGDPIILPSDRDTVVHEMPCFEGVTPDVDDHTGKFAVCVGPLVEDAIGPARVSGHVWCRLQVDDVAEADFADVDDADSTRLLAASEGTARVVWRAGGTGEQDAIVNLGCGTA